MTSSETTEEMSQSVMEKAAEQFAQQLVGYYNGALLTLMIDLGNRVNLFQVAADGPGTSEQLAQRAGLCERYVREWLGAMVTGRIFEYEPTERQYRLAPERAALLFGSGPANLAHLAGIARFLGANLPEVATAFKEGGGVKYDRYFPAFSDFADAVSRGSYESCLVERWLPLLPGLTARLENGARVADLGCATGTSTIAMAAAFPRSSFMGFDITEDLVQRARAKADRANLANVTFAVQDVAQLPVSPAFDVIFAFDAIHDLPDPAGVLERVHRALTPDGIFVMVEPANSSHLEGNMDNPIAPLMYTASTLHCVPVSLAYGGPGLGLVWGEENARKMLSRTGFSDIQVMPAPGDPFNALYFARKSAGGAEVQP